MKHKKHKLNNDSFGYKYLQNKGWTEGSGLGKCQQGHHDPIKVNLKHDTVGVGYDKSDEFTNQWWNHVFNKAAAKVKVETDGDAVTVKSEELSSKDKQKLKDKILYGGFVKGVTLEPGVSTLIPGNDDSESSSDEITKVVTDEDLFKACGGRTAHKGARHGLRLNGKLNRVEECDTPTISDNDVTREAGEDNTSRLHSKAKKKKRKKKNKEEAKLNVEDTDVLPDSSEPKHTSKRKKSRKSDMIQDDSVDVSEIRSSKKKTEDKM